MTYRALAMELKEKGLYSKTTNVIDIQCSLRASLIGKARSLVLRDPNYKPDGRS